MASVLSCWKDIASHLGKGVRTVQRWERDLGLPVRRPNRNNRQIVLAISEELDVTRRLRAVRTRELACRVAQRAYMAHDLTAQLMRYQNERRKAQSRRSKDGPQLASPQAGRGCSLLSVSVATSCRSNYAATSCSALKAGDLRRPESPRRVA